MSKIDREAIIAFSCEQMYALVNDVPAYPEFLPWCAAAKVLSHNQTEMLGELTIRKGKLEKTFSTRNELTLNKSISMNLENGPFEYMRGVWQFKPLSEQACKVSFSLDFAFNSKLLAFTLEPIFSKIANTMIDLFQQRAQQIYGDEHAR